MNRYHCGTGRNAAMWGPIPLCASHIAIHARYSTGDIKTSDIHRTRATRLRRRPLDSRCMTDWKSPTSFFIAVLGTQVVICDTGALKCCDCSRIVANQGVRKRPVNPQVAGSSPARGAKQVGVRRGSLAPFSLAQRGRRVESSGTGPPPGSSYGASKRTAMAALATTSRSWPCSAGRSKPPLTTVTVTCPSGKLAFTAAAFTRSGC